MSIASVIEDWIADFGDEAKVKLIDLRPVVAELEAKIRAAAELAAPQVKADIEAAIHTAETAVESIVASKA